MSDSLQPDAGQNLAEDGSVSFTIDGKVMARGIDLLAATNPNARDDRRIRWLADEGGAMLAEHIVIDEGDPFPNTLGLLDVNSTRPIVTNMLQARAGSGTRRAQVIAELRPADPDHVTAAIGNHRRRIVNELGESDFIRCGYGLENKALASGHEIVGPQSGPTLVTCDLGRSWTAGIEIVVTPRHSSEFWDTFAATVRGVGPTSFDVLVIRTDAVDPDTGVADLGWGLNLELYWQATITT